MPYGLLVITLLSSLAYMTVWFVAAHKRGRLDTVDTAWGLGFVTIAWVTELLSSSPRSFLILLLVTIWGFRLSWHITKRSRTRPEDPRYKELSQKWKGSFWLRAYFSIFLLQGVLVWFISLPIILASGQQLADPVIWLSITGVVVWIIGFITESMADRQLATFLKLRSRPKVLMTGLWRYSRHPNYFGELLQWWAIALIALQAPYGWVGLLGPLLLTILIVFVSGIPPIEKRRLKDPAYAEYKQRTSALIPLPPRPGK